MAFIFWLFVFIEIIKKFKTEQKDIKNKTKMSNLINQRQIRETGKY